MKVFTKLASAAALCALLGSVQAATVTCPGQFTQTLTRAVTVSGALATGAGGECYYKTGNINGDDASVFTTWGSGAIPVLIEKDIAGPNGGGGGSDGLLLYTGAQFGTWAMSSNLWTTYNEIFIGFHFGNGSGNPDSFLVELDPGSRLAATNGTWALIPENLANNLSNIYLFGRGTPAANGNGSGANGGGNVPEPATLALVGLGLLGAAAARRLRV